MIGRCARCNGSLVKGEDGPACLNCGRPAFAPVAVERSHKRVYLPGSPGPRRSDSRTSTRVR